jgi:hypothetical protein
MAQTSFIRFFDKKGEDYNFTPYDSDFGSTFEGAIYFPRVSVNLIESENIFLLQEVTLPSIQPGKLRLTGTASTLAGNQTVNIANGRASVEMIVGELIDIAGTEYEVVSITSDTAINVVRRGTSSPPIVSVTTDNFYRLDYVAYNRLLASPDADTESLVSEFTDESGKFFFYDINYQESLPLIERKRTLETDIPLGATAIDPLTGRIIISASTQNITPIQLNIGFSSADEGVFEEPVRISLKKSKNFIGANWNSIQDNQDGTWTIKIAYLGYLPEFQSVQTIYLSRSIPSGGTQYFETKLVSAAEDLLETTLIVKEINTTLLSTISGTNINSFGIFLVWKELLLETVVYGEAEAEDERFKLVLENFGRKIDEDKEYIFRDSDVNEELTDYRLLNKKRKELLLEGDKIYPYMGSYKALINVLNLFGYYDVEIKEYFMNVDSNSLDNGKYISVPIAKSAEQNSLVKKAWKVLPSKIYKKTSLFGLYYKLNKETGDTDVNGLPLVTEDFQFTPEEVLIKLFGLKELLKRDYLPLNARIYDITGEGIYFERYRINSWSDQVDIRVLEIGKLPDLTVYPEGATYIRDLRYIDEFYKDRFSAQGLTGFLGVAATAPGLTAVNTALSAISGTWVGSFELYAQGKWDYRDQFWESMPPGISNPNFNVEAAYTKQLPDDRDIPTGGPILSEVIFPLPWTECNFQWNEVGIIGPANTEDYLNINLWTWDSISRGEYTDMRITVELTGTQSFRYDTGRQQIENFILDYTDPDTSQVYQRILHAVSLPFTGVYDIAVYIYDATNNFTMQYVQKEVKTPEVEITAAYQAQEIFDNFDDIKIKWKDASFDWYYPAATFSTWEEANLNWQSLEMYFFQTQDLTEDKTLVDILEINRIAPSVLIQGDVTDSPLAVAGEYLFFTRIAEGLAVENGIVSTGSLTRINATDFSIPYNSLTQDVQLYSKVMIKNTNTAFNLLGAQDFFYADVIGVNSTTNLITLRGYNVSVDIFEATNTTQDLYWDAGFYAGTYAIEILSLKVVSGNTLFYLKDTQKELYKIDGYFQPYLTSYDVDYAESHIGIEAENYENSIDTTWNSLDEKAWWSKERHAVLNSGFLITRVGPGSSVEISDMPTFFFSGSTILNQYGYTAMNAAISQLEVSTNEGIQNYEYEIIPSEPINMKTSANVAITTSSTSSGGSTNIAITNTPYNMKMPAELTIGLSGSALTFALASSGAGYDLPPNVTIVGGGGTGASVALSINSAGAVSSILAVGGTGYTTVPTYVIDEPTGYVSGLTDYVWTSREWAKIEGISSNVLSLAAPLVYPVPSGTQLLMPYPWHQTQYLSNPKLLNEFYVAIIAAAKTPSLKNLQSVIFDNGTEGEWSGSTERTYSLPLANSLLFKALNKNYKNAQYQYWESNGKDFPVVGNTEDDSRALYAGAYSEGFAYSDLNITDKSFTVNRATSVVFHDDASRLPAKITRQWKILNAITGEEEVVANSEKLVWKFNRTGEFSIELSITDKHGNIANTTKKSFVEVI